MEVYGRCFCGWDFALGMDVWRRNICFYACISSLNESLLAKYLILCLKFPYMMDICARIIFLSILPQFIGVYWRNVYLYGRISSLNGCIWLFRRYFIFTVEFPRLMDANKRSNCTIVITIVAFSLASFCNTRSTTTSGALRIFLIDKIHWKL